MCFIISDADTSKIFDILNDRRNFKLRTYFHRFTLKSRKRVTHIVMGINASYDVVMKEVFSNARLSIDRFHIIQQMTRAFNNQRIQTMEQLKKSDPQAQKDYRIKVTKRIAFGFRIFRHLRMRVLIQQNICEII